MSLLEVQQTVYKPFHYEWAYERWKDQQKMHWVGWEVPLGDDVVDWNNNISASEKNLLTHIFRFFTQADVEVNDCYMTKYSTIFKPTEIRMMLSAFSAMETIHVDAYSLLLDTIGMPESEYSSFFNIKQMRDKYEFLHQFDTSDKRGVAKTLAAFSAFTEGVQLFSSFAILLNFPRHNKLKGMGQIVSFSVRDEDLHASSMIRLFRSFVEENPEIWDDELKREIYEIAEKTVELEDAFIDLAFEQGGIENLTAAEVKKYIRYIADRRLIELGMKNIFKVKKNPLPWVDYMVSGVEHQNFFEGKATAYAKAATIGQWHEVYESAVFNLREARPTAAQIVPPGVAGRRKLLQKVKAALAEFQKP